MEVNKIICGDALKELKKLPDNSVDLILTDPPYGISYQSARRTESERLKVVENDGKPFIWWLFDAYRVLKDGGSIACFCRWDVSESFRLAMEWAGFTIRSEVIWDRQIHGLGDLNRQFAPQHDTVWFATKGDFKFKNGRPKSVISVQRVSPENLIHPTEKPVSLMRYFVEKLSDKGSLVLDPFMGSGATAVACQNLGRNFIGYDLDEEYVKKAEARLCQTTLIGL